MHYDHPMNRSIAFTAIVASSLVTVACAPPTPEDQYLEEVRPYVHEPTGATDAMLLDYGYRACELFDLPEGLQTLTIAAAAAAAGAGAGEAPIAGAQAAIIKHAPTYLCD